MPIWRTSAPTQTRRESSLSVKICPQCGATYGVEATMCTRDGQLLRAIEDPLVGKTVGGRYRLISRLGQGGMSSVYLARHVLIDRLVAVKTLRRDLAQDPVQRDRFIREARAVNRINHDNIVEINDFGETDDGWVYLVMEYVPGHPLARALSDAPMPPRRALHYAEQIGAALGRAHQMGVVHRDLKPENILLVPRKVGYDAVKVLDFGIAKIMDAPALTGSQQIFGTPGYIAPEYIQSTDIDGRADLYSLGVVLYEMVTGALPFDYEYPGDLLVKHVTEKPIPPRERLASIHPALEAFVLRCLEKKPDDRFRDAYHFVEELRLVRERLGGADSWAGMERREWDDEPTPIDPPETATQLLERTILRTQPAPPPEMDPIPSPPRQQVPELAHSGAFEGPDLGPAGVHRWRERFDALTALYAILEPSEAIADRLEQARQTLVNLESAVQETETHQRLIETIDAGARDFRTTLGLTIDRLGEKLSAARGEQIEIAGRRRQLRERHEALVAEVRAGQGDEGPADAVLWELATVEQELRGQDARVAAVSSRLADLQAELRSRNEDVEDRLADAVRKSGRAMGRVDDLAQAMRDPLAEVEAHVRSRT